MNTGKLLKNAWQEITGKEFRVSPTVLDPERHYPVEIKSHTPESILNIANELIAELESEA